MDQRKLAESFIREQFHDTEGRNLRAYQTYREPVDFVARLRTHLQQTLDDLLGADAAPRWHEEPYRGLEVFDVRHADIFCGRDEETCDLLQRLRDQRRAGCAFAVIVGASGSGKSSLARAGVAATLLQHAGDDGVKQWRTAFVLPGAAILPDNTVAALARVRANVETTRVLANAATSETPPSGILNALARTLAEAVPELDTSPTSLDDISIGLTQDPALTIRLSITPAFARAAESAKGEVRLLLVIDQMEELWTDRRITSEDRDQFFAVIEALSRSGHVTVLATLRSDFYPHAQQVPAFLRLKGERGHFDLLPPSAAALQRLIVEPARLAGLTFERHEQTNRSLDEIILQDAARDPTVLPLLQYALRELYEMREELVTSPSRAHQEVANGNDARPLPDELVEEVRHLACQGGSRASALPNSSSILSSAEAREPLGQAQVATNSTGSERRCLLTFAAYEQLGGVEGALGRRASATFHALPPEAQATLGTLLPHLVTIDVTGEQTAVRRRARLIDLRLPAQQILVDALIAARFLTTDRQDDTPIVSLAHEALLRRWDELAQWITSNREHLRLRARVEHSQHRWASQGQHASLLLPTGLPLEEGQVLLKEARPLLLAETTEYIERSLTHRQSESRRQRLIRTTALTMSLTAALIAILAALWINTERNAALDARADESKAKGEALLAQAEESKAKDAAKAAQISAERQEAAALRDNADHFWRTAVSHRDTKNGDQILASHLFLRGAEALSRIPQAHTNSIDRDFAVSQLYAANVIDRRIVRNCNHNAHVNGFRFNRDESRMLTWSDDGTARLWDMMKPDPIQTFQHNFPVSGSQFSLDESILLTWGQRGTFLGGSYLQSGEAIVWDITKSEPICVFRHQEPIKNAELSRNGKHVLTVCNSNNQTQGVARLWDVNRAELIRTFNHNGSVIATRFGADGSRVLTCGEDGTARLWDVTKSEPLQIFSHDNRINGAQFSHNESRVLTWSWDGTARLWDVTKSDPIQTFKHDNAVSGAQFSRDESRVLTWSWDNTARLWGVTQSEPLQTFKHSESVIDAQFSHDESRVLTRSHDKTVWLWDVTTSDPLRVIRHNEFMKHDDFLVDAQLSRDGSRVLTATYHGTSCLWDVPTREPLQILTNERNLSGARFTGDGSHVVTWGGDYQKSGGVCLWDLTKSEARKSFQHDASVNGAQFNRDESRVLTWSDKAALLWNIHEAVVERRFDHDAGVSGAWFSRDESRVLTWGADNTVRLWDVTKTQPIQTFKHTHSLSGVRSSQDESRVLTWSEDKNVRLWDIMESEPIRMLEYDQQVNGASFSGDNSLVLIWSGSGDEPGEVLLWDVTRNKLIRTFSHVGAVRDARFWRDTSHILSCDGKAARLWNVAESEPVQIFKHDSPVTGLQLSQDESRLLTWSADNTLRLWDMTKSEPLQFFKYDHMVIGARFSHDESRFVTWSHSDNATLWDTVRSEPLSKFDYSSMVCIAGTVPNGAPLNHRDTWLLTFIGSNTARLWDVTKPDPLQTFKHDSYVIGAQFSHDESRVLTWSGDKTARLWDCSDPLGVLTPTERILELEVRSGSALDNNLKRRVLGFEEWQAKVRSPEYRAIEQKLAKLK